MDNEAFYRFCRLNKDTHFERDAEGNILIMSPVGGGGSSGNMKISSQVDRWAELDGTGIAFDSSGGFVLPNTAVRNPDTAWVLNERLDSLRDDQWQRFLPLAPDFVIEFRSANDRLPPLKGKMAEYIANGVRLAFLIDPLQKKVHIYRPDQEPIVLDNPETVSGDPVLRGFTLKLAPVWAAFEPRRRKLS
jgi:Uma2 family endonuclease